jgi:hypothetical protein
VFEISGAKKLALAPMNSPADWNAIPKALQPYLAMEPEFRKRVADARSSLARLKKQTHAGIMRWEWYADFHHELDPMCFILGYDVKPGRMLKREPMSKLGTVRYGFDSQNRVVTDEKYLTSEEFREHKADRIDAARFHTSKKCIDLQSLWLDKNQPKAYIRINQKGVLIRLYEFKGGKITGVLEAEFENPATKTKSEWMFHHYTIVEKRPGAFLIHCAHENGYIEKRGYVAPALPKQQAAPPALDLRKEVKSLSIAISELIAKFSKLQKVKGKKAVPPISALLLDFRHFADENPGLTLGFDTRPEHLDDGEWTHPHWASIDKPTWKDFYVECEVGGGRGVVIDARGKQNALRLGSNMSRQAGWFGEMVVAALSLALKKHPLLLSSQCSIEVTDYAGFSWRRFALEGRKEPVRGRWIGAPGSRAANATFVPCAPKTSGTPLPRPAR